MSTEEHRTRSSKPLMEKRRRARINESLLQLKNLVLDALNKNNPRHSKLEKADILEMTVRYLRSVNRQNMSRIAPNQNPVKLTQYRTGYSECMSEVSRYLGSPEPNPNSNNNNDNNPSFGNNTARVAGSQDATEMHVRLQLLNHLASQCSNTTREPPGKMLPPPQPRNIASSIMSTNNVQSMQVHIGGTPPGTCRSNQLHGCTSAEEREDGGENELTGLRGPVVARPPTADSRAHPGTTVEPRAYPTAGQSVLMTGSEITLVLPQHLMQTGQIPTHLIPVYATSPPVSSSAVHSNAPLSSPSRVMLTPVAPSNIQLSSPVAGATASPTGFAFFPNQSTTPYPQAATSSLSHITLSAPLGFSPPRHHYPPVASPSASSSSGSPSSSSSVSTSPSTEVLPPLPPPPTLDVHAPSFSPVAIALPVQAKLISATPNGSGQSHFPFQSAIPLKPTITSTPHPPGAPTPALPDPHVANAAANAGREDRDANDAGVNGEVKLDPMWRPW